MHFLLPCFLLLFFLSSSSPSAQVPYTANDTVFPYQEEFLFGSNMGYFPPWTDEQLAELAAGAPDKGIKGLGIRSLRPGLFAHFLEQWGYDIRTNAFAYYHQLGHRDLTAITGYPADQHRDTTQYCPGQPSELFANLYAPIWDNGENGTPVNDTNYFALYLYKMVDHYGEWVRFWEIWNEPDFSYSTSAWAQPGYPGNWWENDPEPCEIAIKAPIYHYVRLLRVAYEVIKTLRPESYVAVGGLGYPGFLHALMRHTDNPMDGSVNSEYPLKGGAYFDVLSYHSYPHIDGSLREWNNDINGFFYRRHSDAAAQGVINRKKQFELVLSEFGYDGNTYPRKHTIITECNIPREAFQDYIGSEEAQRNFVLKTVVQCLKNEVAQLYLYNLGDLAIPGQAASEFHLMGLYPKLAGDNSIIPNPNDAGIAYSTASELLNGFRFDSIRTDFLQLPDRLEGMAMVNKEEEYVYVLWTKTQTDRVEYARSFYSFPSLLGIQSLQKLEWDYEQTGQTEEVSSRDVELTETPAFFFPLKMDTLPPPAEEEEKTQGQGKLQISPNPGSDQFVIDFFVDRAVEINMEIRDAHGRKMEQLFYYEPMQEGYYSVELSAANLPSGLYFCHYRPRRGDPAIRKFVVIKEE